MTAIAWDGKTLAADTMFDQDGNTGYTPKLYTVEHPIIGKMIVGFCGTTRGMSLMISQLEKDIIKQVDDYDVKMIYGIAIDSAKNVYNIYGDGYCVIEHAKNSICVTGSAWEFLLGAMRAGASAERAIDLAITYRSDVGGSVDSLHWVEVFKGYDHERFNDDIPY